MKRLIFSLIVLLPLPLISQTASISGFCEQGAKNAVTSGLSSSNYLDGIIPSCTVTVYLTGTTTRATIYADNINTPLANPFTASSTGQWLAYAAINQGYDVVLSGGISPNIYTTPVTITGLYPGANITFMQFGCEGSGGSIICTTVTSSVNGQINVMAPPYNAKCDGSTDDLAAFNAAYAEVQAINDAADKVLTIGWGTQAVLYAPAGVTCALSGTFIAAWGGVDMYGARLVPIPITADYTLIQDGNKFGQGPQWNSTTCLAAGDNGCEPSRSVRDWLPNVYRQKAGPGWSDTTHCAVEAVSLADSEVWVGEITGFQRGLCAEDAYGVGSYNTTFHLGWMENEQGCVDQVALDQYSYVNSDTYMDGNCIVDSSNAGMAPFTPSLPAHTWYGTLINDATWLANTSLPLPNVVTGVSANSNGSGGFPATITSAVMAAKPLLVGGNVEPPMLTIPDGAYVSQYCNASGHNYGGSSCSPSNTVTMSYDFTATTTSGSNEITGAYDTGYTMANPKLVGETANTIYIVPNVPPFTLGTIATYTTITSASGTSATMSQNAQGSASGVNFVFYAGASSTVIAAATGTVTAGSPTITSLVFSAGNIAALVNGTTFNGGGYVIPSGNVTAITSTTGVTLQASSTVSGSYSCYFTNQSYQYIINSTKADFPCTLTSGSLSVALTGGAVNTLIHPATTSGLESTITGTGIPANAKVLFVDSLNSFSIAVSGVPTNATASGTVTLTAPAYSNVNSTDLGIAYTNTDMYWPIPGTYGFKAEIYPSQTAFPPNAFHVIDMNVEGAGTELQCKVWVYGASGIFDALRYESPLGGRVCLQEGMMVFLLRN